MASTILISGATGFLGKIISHVLTGTGSKILTIGRLPSNDFRTDLAAGIPDLSPAPKVDLVIHAAGKAHSVPRTTKEEESFFEVNFEGTKNLCHGIERSGLKPKSFVFISTVAVYGLDEGEGITEDTPLNGKTPYARSKILAENWLKGWADRNGITLSILRLPLVAGPKPPGNLGAMVAAIRKGKYLRIGDGSARKSIVWAADVARIIPAIAETGGIYHLCDGYDPTFRELEDGIAVALKKPQVKAVPYWMARLLALAGDVAGERAPINTHKLSKITSSLTFDCSKANSTVGWQPSLVLEKIADII